MCRIFVWRDLRAESNPEYLEHRLLDFLKQSDHLRKYTPGIQNEHDHQTHMDGFGFAWYRNRRWESYRNPLLYSRVPDLPKYIQRVARNTFVLGHIRKATGNTATIVENNHPFYYRNHVFLHNGLIYGFEAKRDVVLAEIDADLRGVIRGQTDSEAFFYVCLSKMRALRDKSLHSAFLETLAFFESHFEFLTLNVVLANKTHTLVSRYCTPVKNHRPPSLYWNLPISKSIPTEGITGVFPKVVISSEPILDNQTQLIPANTLIQIENDTGNVSMWNIRHLRAFTSS